MQKIHFSTTIDAPRSKVWDTMLEDATYRQWTAAFNPKGSWYEGDWNQGSTIRFLGPGEDGAIGGMVARIKESRLHEYVSVEHVGLVENGRDDTTSDAAKQWTPAFENYTFKDKGGATELLVEMDIDERHATMFDESWPKALRALKELAER